MKIPFKLYFNLLLNYTIYLFIEAKVLNKGQLFGSRKSLPLLVPRIKLATDIIFFVILADGAPFADSLDT